MDHRENHALVLSDSYLTPVVWEQGLEVLFTLPENSSALESQPLPSVIGWLWENDLTFISVPSSQGQ